MIFLAVPFSAHQDVAKQFEQWNGKIIVGEYLVLPQMTVRWRTSTGRRRL